METDMPGGGGDHALGAVEHGLDHDPVGLGAAHQKVDLRFGTANGSPDLFFGGVGVVVGAIAGQGLHIGFDKALQQLGVGAHEVVAFKMKHNSSPFCHDF